MGSFLGTEDPVTDFVHKMLLHLGLTGIRLFLARNSSLAPECTNLKRRITAEFN